MVAGSAMAQAVNLVMAAQVMSAHRKFKYI
jgi:hypothetical protein